MIENYFELRVQSPYIDVFKDFVFELGATCIEEISSGFILRDEEDLEPVKWGLEELAKRANLEIKTSLATKKNEDWIEKYKNGVQPITAGKFYIRPSWQSPKNELIDIIIDPALAFGSGHHESTNSCLTLISKYLPSNSHKTALDVGCGSGILSIALAKLGLKIYGCDTDEIAVESSKENAQKNGVKFEKIWLGSIKNDQKFDIIIANLTADIILPLSQDLKNSLNVGGYLIISGILTNYKERILENFQNLELVENLTKNEWESFIYKEKNGK